MTHAWRLTFAYEGETFTLQAARKLEMRVPPGQETDHTRSGKFVELRGPQGKVMYRRRINELLPDSIEYPTGDPRRPFGRTPARRRGEVSVLVPALAGGQSVALVVAGKPADGAGGSRLRDLVQVDLPRDAQQDGEPS